MGVLIFVFLIFVFLYSVIIHEISHGAMANYLGDPTAKMAGRLSLNPLKHLDPIGSIILPVLLIMVHSNIIVGWAKPVPVNPLNLRDKRYGEAKVALAGPAANFLMAVVFGLLARFALQQFQLVFLARLAFIFGYICWINLVLAVFNLIPIPPLDGAHILFAVLPKSAVRFKLFLVRYGFLILIFLIFFFFNYFSPIVNFLFKLIIGQNF